MQWEYSCPQAITKKRPSFKFQQTYLPFRLTNKLVQILSHQSALRIERMRVAKQMHTRGTGDKQRSSQTKLAEKKIEGGARIKHIANQAISRRLSLHQRSLTLRNNDDRPS
jgi:hypothetical protein